MKRLEKYLPERTALLYAGILLYTLERCWNASLILPYSAGVDEVLKIGFALMMVLVIAGQEFTPRLYVIYGLAAVGAAAIRLRTGLMLDVYTILIILACREADLTRVVNIIRRGTTVFLAAHTCLFFCLVLLGRQELFYADPTGRVRCGLGLLHPNLMASYFFNLVLMWAWEKYDSIRLPQIAGVLVIATVLYWFTDSRTSYLCTIALCVLLAVRRSRFVVWGLNLLARWITPGLALLVLVCSYHWKEGLAGVIDTLLNGRIKHSAYGITNFGFTLFGQEVDYGTVIDPKKWRIFTPDFTFDCVYSYLWCNIGILWLVLIILCFYRLAKLDNPRISLCLIFWALYGMSEVTVMSIVRFFPLLLICILFLPKEEADRLYAPKPSPGGPASQ